MEKVFYWARAILISLFAAGFLVALYASVLEQIQNPPTWWEVWMATLIALAVGLANSGPSQSNQTAK